MATAKQVTLLGKIVENSRLHPAAPKPLGQLMRESGYSPATAIKPTQVTKSKGFMELVDEMLPDNELMEVHKQLLGTKKIEHMVFPLGPKDEDDPNMSGSAPNAKNPMDDLTHPIERTTLSDKEITDMLAGVGGTVKRIVHGQTARHVYFWVANDKARHDALKLAYDLKGKLGKQDALPPSNTYNTYIQNNRLDPNAPSSRALADKMLEVAMEQTKRKVIPSGQTNQGS